jgi:hypothetical protein
MKETCPEHDRLYDKWILPDWFEVPVKRHLDLAAIATDLKLV